MHWVQLLYFLVIGSCIGCFSGLLGLGGGLIVVPILHWIFKLDAELAPFNMHLAIATSLAVMVITSLVATLSHATKNAVLWRAFFWMSLGLVAGAIFGPIISDQFHSRALEIIFGTIEILIAVSILVFKRKNATSEIHNISQKKTLPLLVGGFFAGFLGSMLGIGGGVIIVPLLLFLKIPSQMAVGTSSATTMVTAVIGTFSQLWMSRNFFIPMSVGFIYVPAAIALAVGSLLFTPLGVKFAHKLPEKHLKKIFVFVLVAFGIIMIL